MDNDLITKDMWEKGKNGSLDGLIKAGTEILEKVGKRVSTRDEGTLQSLKAYLTTTRSYCRQCESRRRQQEEDSGFFRKAPDTTLIPQSNAIEYAGCALKEAESFGDLSEAAAEIECLKP